MVDDLFICVKLARKANTIHACVDEYNIGSCQNSNQRIRTDTLYITILRTLHGICDVYYTSMNHQRVSGSWKIMSLLVRWG